MLTRQNTKTHVSGNESDDVHIPVQIDGFEVIASENVPHSDDDNSVSNSDHHISVNTTARESHNEKTCGGLSKVEGARKSQEVLYLNQVLFGSVEDFIGQVSLNENNRSIDDVPAKRNEEEALHESHHTDENPNPESTDASKVLNPDPFRSEPLNENSCIHIQDYVLTPSGGCGQLILDTKANSLVVEELAGNNTPLMEPETLLYRSQDHKDSGTGEVVKDSVIDIGLELGPEDDQNNQRSEENPSNLEIPLRMFAGKSSEMGSNSLEIYGSAEPEVPLNRPNAVIAATNANSEDLPLHIKEIKSEVSHAQKEPYEVSEQPNYQHVVFPTNQPVPIGNEGDNTDGSIGNSQIVENQRVDSKEEMEIENSSDIVEGCSVPTSKNVMVEHMSEKKAEYCKDFGLAQPEVGLTSAASNAIICEEVQVIYPIQTGAYSNSIQIESIGTPDIFHSANQVPEDDVGLGWNNAMQDELILKPNDLNENDFGKGSEFSGLDCGRFGVEGLQSSEGQPEITYREYSFTGATPIGNDIVDSQRLDATVDHLKEKRFHLSNGDESLHAPALDASGGSGKTSIESGVCQDTELDLGGHNVAAVTHIVSRRDLMDSSGERIKDRQSPDIEKVDECATDDLVIRTGGQRQRNESDNRPSGNLYTELLSTKDCENGLCKFEAQNAASKEHASSSPVSLDHSLQDEGDTNTGCSFDTAAFAVDASVDSFSQCDSVEGCWGSISDWTLTSRRDAIAHADVGTVVDTNTSFRKSTDSSDTILKQSSTYKVHCADMNEDLFEAPSFMTWVLKPGKEANRQPTPTEVLPNPKPEHPNSPDSQAAWFPSLTNIVNKSQGRKRNEEFIAKVASWSSAKSPPSLSRLLVEANIESKHKSMMAQKLENSQATKSRGESTPNKVHNSPSKLPLTKRERKKIWLSFTCCLAIR